MSLDVLHAYASIGPKILGRISRSYIVWRAASKHTSISYIQIIHVKGDPLKYNLNLKTEALETSSVKLRAMVEIKGKIIKRTKN